MEPGLVEIRLLELDEASLAVLDSLHLYHPA